MPGGLENDTKISVPTLAVANSICLSKREGTNGTSPVRVHVRCVHQEDKYVRHGSNIGTVPSDILLASRLVVVRAT